MQVKSGKVSSPLIRDLKGTVDREKAALGLFITLDLPPNPPSPQNPKPSTQNPALPPVLQYPPGESVFRGLALFCV